MPLACPGATAGAKNPVNVVRARGSPNCKTVALCCVYYEEMTSERENVIIIEVRNDFTCDPCSGIAATVRTVDNDPSPRGSVGFEPHTVQCPRRKPSTVIQPFQQMSIGFKFMQIHAATK